MLAGGLELEEISEPQQISRRFWSPRQQPVKLTETAGISLMDDGESEPTKFVGKAREIKPDIIEIFKEHPTIIRKIEDKRSEAALRPRLAFAEK